MTAREPVSSQDDSVGDDTPPERTAAAPHPLTAVRARLAMLCGGDRLSFRAWKARFRAFARPRFSPSAATVTWRSAAMAR